MIYHIRKGNSHKAQRLFLNWCSSTAQQPANQDIKNQRLNRKPFIAKTRCRRQSGIWFWKIVKNTCLEITIFSHHKAEQTRLIHCPSHLYTADCGTTFSSPDSRDSSLSFSLYSSFSIFSIHLTGLHYADPATSHSEKTLSEAEATDQNTRLFISQKASLT